MIWVFGSGGAGTQVRKRVRDCRAWSGVWGVREHRACGWGGSGLWDGGLGQAMVRLQWIRRGRAGREAGGSAGVGLGLWLA